MQSDTSIGLYSSVLYLIQFKNSFQKVIAND